MIHELRTYDVVPGKLPALHERMAKRMIPLFRKHGIELTAAWVPEVGGKTNHRLVYILAYESLADREEKWAAFLSDEEVLQLVAETEGAEPWVLRSENTLLRPTEYSPLT